MKGIAAFMVLVLLQLACVAQNLVPNGSFEPIDSCIESFIDYQSIAWQKWRESPDCFNACSPFLNLLDSLMDVPLNGVGFQFANLDNGYIGLGCYGQPGISDNAREYAGTQLLEPLHPDTAYFVCFETCLALNGFYWILNHACNNIGVLFTMTGYDLMNSPLEIPNESHVYTTAIVEDTLNWTHVEDIFTPTLPYTHMGIGNFFDSDNTEYIQYAKGLGAYYYVDNVVVMKLSDYNQVLEVSTRPEILTIEPGNKYNCLVPGKSAIATLFDIQGKQIWTSSFFEQLTIDLTPRNAGIYLLKLETGKNNQFIYKLNKL